MPEPLDSPKAAPAERSGASAPPSRFPWPPVLLIAALAGGVLLQRTWPLAWPGMNDLPARLIGWSFLVGGLALAAWALWTMVKGGAEFRPHAPATQLITSGPFRRFRNPIYLGDALILLGLADVTQNIWIVIMAAGFVAAVTWLAILPEERHLEERFGETYLTYKAGSRRWI